MNFSNDENFSDFITDYDLKDLRKINLQIFFNSEEILDFLNDKKTHLTFNLNRKYETVFQILVEVKTFNEFLDVIKAKDINLNESFLKIIRQKFSQFKNSKNLQDFWEKLFDWKKIIKAKTLNLLEKQISNYQNFNLWGKNNLFLTANTLEVFDEEKKVVLTIPFILCPVQLVVDKDKKINIIKINPQKVFYNSQLFDDELQIFKRYSNQDFNLENGYEDLLSKFIFKNSLKEKDGEYKNKWLNLKPNFYLENITFSDIKIELKNLFNFRWMKNFDTGCNYDNVIQQQRFQFEKFFLKHQNQQVLHYGAANIINEEFILKLVFANVAQNKNAIIFNDQYRLISHFLSNSHSPLKNLIFFNFHDLDYGLFYDQILNLKNKLEEFSVDDTKHFVGSFLEYDKDENNFLEIFQKIYLMNSIQEQNLDFSLWLINEKTKNKNWSEWAMIAFNYCQAQNIKLNSLIKKLKVIYNLSIDHNKFLASYGYDDFWKNLKQHEKFLVDYDESVMEKGLFYLKKYIELKKLPDKVRFYTLSEDDRINYTTLYKFFYNAANTKLFYVSWADLKILLNAKLVNREEFLAITNENWIRNQPVFNTFINSDLFQKRLIDNFSDEKYQHNLDILVHNYFLNLWKRITDFSPNQKNELQKMFNYATNKNGKIPPSLFIDKFWKIILELFPFIIWDLHNNLYFNEKVFYNKFNTAYWFISHKNAKLIPQIFSHWENTHVFYYYAEENLGYSLNAQIKNLNIKEFNINYNLNTNNYRIAKTINNLFLAVDKNDHKIDRKIKTILVNENYFFKDINLSLFKKLIDDFNNLFLEKNDQSVNVIVVKNQFHKNYLLKIFLSYPTIMTAIAENKLIVLNLDEEINFPVERIFFVLNDRISFTKNLSLNSFYNDPKMRTDLIKFLFWAKNSVIVYAPFSKEQIDLKNKKNQLLLRNLFTENLEKKERSQDNLIYQVHKKIKDWLFNLLEDKYQIQITFNEATGQFYTSVSDRKNRAILFIKLIHNESISLDHNLELSFFMKQKNYSVYNLFIYEWIFKEEMVKKELTTFLIKEKIID